jgi:hypothetical protein
MAAFPVKRAELQKRAIRGKSRRDEFNRALLMTADSCSRREEDARTCVTA